jgi:hypothetical protein
MGQNGPGTLRPRTCARERSAKYVEATGWMEAEALRDLAGLLREWNVEP